ncbi:MAG: hypothetical protein PHO89_11710 [Methylacidiphilaceae bacterium]|nr:hypothetical protein [Candidatus Methylacidiphilaceae bacterium]
MPAIATLEALQEAKAELEDFAGANPEGYARMVEILTRHRMIGYKNIARLAMGKTPAELKA